MMAVNPSTNDLTSFISDLNASLRHYEAAQTPADRAITLQTLANSAERLHNATIKPSEAFSNFTLQPLANFCVRIAISIRLFECLPTNEALSIEELAKLTNSEETLVMRVVRVLVAFKILAQSTSNATYSHTPFSRIYIDKSQNAWAMWMWDEMIRSSTSIGSYFEENDFEIPKDSKNTPFSWVHGEKDSDIFEIVQKTGKAKLLQDAMSGSSILCAKEAVATYMFDDLTPGKDEVILVDVGGNRGQTLLEIKRSYPNIKGRLILQDLQTVIQAGSVPETDIELQAYDFFKEIQPVKCAGAYFYQRIFHDWNDNYCKKILQNLKPAMGPESKLLISDVVVPDHNPNATKLLRDMNMLLIGGMERSESQWHFLLESEGFVITKIFGLKNLNNSIIEAVVR